MVLRRKKLRSANIGLLRDLQLGVLVQHKLIKFYSTRSYLTRGEIVKELFERFFSFPSSLRYGMLNNNQFDFCVSLARVDRPHGLGLLPLPQKQKKRTIIMAEAPSSVAPIAIYSTTICFRLCTPTIGYEIPSSKSHQFRRSLFTKKPPWRQERDYVCGNKNQHENLRQTPKPGRQVVGTLSINDDSR